MTRGLAIAALAALTWDPGRALAGEPPAAAPAAAPSPAPTSSTKPAKPDDDEGVVRLSLPTEDDRQAWQRHGFRLGLGVAYGQLSGYGGAPGGRLLAAVLRTGVRLDETWSLLASFHYALASQTGGLSGLRFAGTLDPTYHATPNLSLAIGLGFGGIVEGRTGRADAEPLASTLVTSYTFPNARTPIASCSGVGVAALVRGEWGYVLGPRAQTSVAVEIDGQLTGCVDETERVEADTGQAVVRRQYWAHSGVTVAWTVTWR